MIIETQGILFDMDGVLISSIASVRRCWRRWAKHYGVSGWETFEIPHGTRAREIIATTVPGIDIEEGLRLIEDMEIEDTEGLEVLPGVRDLLTSLPADRWSIVTSATRRLVIERLRVADLPVPLNLISAESVANGKPSPDPYVAGAKLLSLSAAECLVVEDAPAGIDAGNAAGSKTLGVLGTHALQELHAATWVVQSLEGVKVETLPDGLRLGFEALPR